MAYEVRITPAAERAIGKLPGRIQLAVLDKLGELAKDARPHGCRKIRGVPPQYDVLRVEVESSYRIVYQVKDEAAWILVVKVGDRKEVYRRLDDLKRLLQ